MTSEAFESFEHAGMTCELHPDYEPMSPADWDTLGTLAGFEHVRRNWSTFGDDLFRAEEAYDRRESADMLRRYLRWQGIAAVPCYFADYGASGARIYESDSPNCYIYTTREQCEKLGTRWEDAEQQLRAELDEWNAYFGGAVVGFVVKDAAGDVVSSCWGFYPDSEGDGLEYVRSEARAAAEYEAAERDRAARQDIATRTAPR